MKKFVHALFHSIFWFWNLTFLLAVYGGILPHIGIDLFKAVLAGEIEGDFLFTLVALVAIPTICTLLGGWRFRKQPLQLVRLFYGVEAPLFLLCLIRFFVIREFTAATGLIVGTAALCMLAFMLELLWGYAERNRVVSWLQMAIHSLMLVVGTGVGLLLLFYAVPAAASLIQAFFKFDWLNGLFWVLTYQPFEAIFWALISSFLFSFSATLFLAMPSALASLYIYSGYCILRAFASQYGQTRTIQGSMGVLTAWMVLLISFQQQPQIQAFKLLENPAQIDSQRQELLAKSDEIQKGLLNAYLSSYRYLSTREESNQIRYMYESVFGLPDSLCQFIQNSYNVLISPFLYNGSRTDEDKAEKLYAQFFDTPIQKAERKAIRHALQSTSILDDAKAGVLNINQEKVLLRSQQVTVKPQGDWAEVELYEVYANQTPDVEEIFYSFSLPESAVITGLWLGDSDNLAKRFPFKVSPRGAAQKVYNSQVRRQRPVDPALLEQVGPRHYRLRAFPIPPRLSPRQQPLPNQPTEMHLWMTYKVMRQEKGWALPKLGEKRNIFWTKDSKRIRNGKVMAGFQDDWLEAFLPASGQYQPTQHQASLPEGYQILAQPLAAKDYSLPQGKRFAVVLDVSRSMAAHAKELTETFDWLKKHGFADNSFANNDADLYLTAASGAKPQRIDDIRNFNATKMTFYGTIQPKEMLRQFAQLRGDTPYDGILLVTDEGSYELSDNSKDVPAISAPLWLVHLGGTLPPAYDDGTLKAIQNSGGGVSTALPKVLQRQATQAALGSSAVSVVDGYAWFIEKVEEPSQSADTTQNSNSAQLVSFPTQTSNPDGFETLAARQMVLGLSKEIAGNQLEKLDAIHAIAKTYKIVTPYSSMIVLVNDEQREALKQAEADKDRFNRKVENGKERLNRPNNPLSVSVPEPGTIVGLVAIALFLIGTRQRNTIKLATSINLNRGADKK